MRFSLCAALLLLVGLSGTARAEWTINGGYHNPIDSYVGLNLQYFGSQWAFEAGVGYANAHDETTTDAQGNKKTTSTSVAASGDVDLKYLFSSGKLRPYLQGGFGVGIGAKTGQGAGAGTGGGFVGLGLMLGSPGLYAYGAYNLDSAKNGVAQGGIGLSL